MIKAVFIDFDSTLYSHTKNCIPDSAIEAINKMRENNIKVYLCTGRSMCEMASFDLSKVNYDGFIGDNGQTAYDHDNNVIYDNPISGRLKQELITLFNNKKTTVLLNTKERLIANMINQRALDTLSAVNSPIPVIADYNDEKFYMSSVFYGDKNDWDQLFTLEDIANITYWHDGSVDVVPKYADKAKGIEKIITSLEIKPEETAAFGDSDNDISMFDYCGLGIAMGNAMDTTKKVADYITDHIDENGLYNACKHFNLN